MVGGSVATAKSSAWVEAVSQLSEDNQQTGDIDKGLIHLNMILPSHHQPSKVSPPRKGSFNGPPSLVATQCAPILRRRFGAIFSMWTDQLDAPSGQPSPQRIRIGGFIVDETLRIFPRPTPTGSRHPDPLQRRLDQRDFRRGCRVQVVSQRKTLAVDHHHPLRTLSTFGFADTGPPFFAGAKLPSAKVSAPSSWPCSSSCFRSARQASSQTSCSSQSRNRRQQVLGDGYRCGRSFQRAPLRKTHKIPSNTGRFGIGLGPPLGDALGSGSKGAICVHCASVNSD